MDLRKMHFLDWSDQLKSELKDEILQRFKELFPKLEIEDIIVAGSRVVLKDHPVFKEDSDLDAAVLINEETFSKYFNNDALFQADQKEKGLFRSRLLGFDFHNVRISLFVRPKHVNYKNYFYKYNLSYYSLLSNKLYRGNVIDEVDYYMHTKPRLEKHSFCYICEEFKDAPYIVDITIRKRGQTLGDTLTSDNIGFIYMCESCASKIGRNVCELITTLQNLR